MNPSELVTTVPMTDIPDSDFISFVDGKRVYGFDTHTLTDETADGGKVDGTQMYLAIEEFVEQVDQDTVAAFAFMGA